ncbi:DUF4178 domain-containing protein [Flavobacterium sp.]|uniref:DUF4178 domain-containing protein n=1 Tax=Flavobacterium sp. TaxID=239 RepID=UPI0026049459|nr:DUF4178 domain-containing protein [Flavobacterium sp.]
MEVSCLSCNHVLNVQYEVSYHYYICVKCFSLHKNENGNLKLKSSNKSSFNYVIPIGTIVDFENQKYCVSNVILKKDLSNDSWLEYELISDNNSKKYFTEENGNWTVSEEIELKSTDKFVREIYYEDIDYRLFDRGKYIEFSGAGFFEYQIDKDEKLEYADFICPPSLLSIEIEDGKQTSFLGKHISSKEIKSIFNIKSVPTKSQVGMVQPFYFNLNNTIIVFCSACIFILISHLYFSSTSKNQLVYSNEINLLNNNNKEISTDVFELKGPIAPLKIFINSDVDNSWVATDFSLVNQTTGESSYFSKDIEYYHGYEGGENWTEGDTTDEFNICGVSSGKYKITFVPSKDTNDVSNSRFKIDVFWDKSDNWNFVSAFVVFLIIVIILFFIKNSFEQRRWNDSDYSPYSKEE